MLFLSIIIFVISTSVLTNFYIQEYIKGTIKNQVILKYVLYGVLFITALAICSNLAHIGLIFNPQAPDYNFMDTVDGEYTRLFITNIIGIAVIISGYLMLTRKMQIPPYFLLIILLVWVLYQYYPGIPSADGIDTSYNQFLNNSYTDFQPPLFTVWWKIFHAKSAAFIMNSLFYYIGLIYISYFLHKRQLKWQNDLLVLFCLNPILFTQLAIIWKDISFTGFVVDCVALYLAIPTIQNKYVKNTLWGIYFIIIFLAIGFRLNGNITVFPFILAGLYKILSPKFNGKKPVIVTIVTGLLITGLFTFVNIFITYHIFNAKRSNVENDVMLANMAAMECISNHEFQINVNYFQPPTEDSRDVFCTRVVNYFNNDAYYANWSGTGVQLITNAATLPQIKSEWKNALFTNPLLFIKYRAEYFSNVLFYNYWYPTGTLFEQPDYMSKIAQYQKLDMKMELPLFMLAITISLLACCFYYRIYGISLIIVMSSILQLLTLYLLIPNHSARYFFWNYIGTVLALVLLILDIKQEQNNSESNQRKLKINK